MELIKIGLRSDSKKPEFSNFKGSTSSRGINLQRVDIPDEIYEIEYEIYDVKRTFSVRSLLEIDVTELSEMTIANLRVQLEQVASIRMTLGKAYEQLMEKYGFYKIKYDIWLAEKQAEARDRYWVEQQKIMTKFSLAKSGMKAPTQDDIQNTILSVMGWATEYEIHQENIIRFQRAKSNFEKIDSILMGRGFDIKTILETRLGKGG